MATTITVVEKQCASTAMPRQARRSRAVLGMIHWHRGFNLLIEHAHAVQRCHVPCHLDPLVVSCGRIGNVHVGPVHRHPGRVGEHSHAR